MKKKVLGVLLTACMAGAMLAGCGNSATQQAADTAASAAGEAADAAGSAAEEAAAAVNDELTATVSFFAAKSLNTVMEEVITEFNKQYPNVKIEGSYDSSGTLMEQIKEGFACDVFFSAAQSQMNELEEGGFVVDGTRSNVVNNQVVVVTQKGSKTEVKGLDTLSKAKNMALADGSVPVGKYTRTALMNAGILEKVEDPATITSEQVAEALGGIEINQCKNVGEVTAAVAEGSNEVGTVYKSDTYGQEDKLDILETVSYDLTGDVIYPIAQINNKEADETEVAAAKAFVAYVSSPEVKAIFDKYYFDTNVE